MRRKRKTLRKELVFRGSGIHSGKRSSVKISPNAEGCGITFSFGARRYNISEARIEDTTRSTALVFPGRERVRTAEHLLSAIAGTCLDDADIAPEGEEIPILDGSSLPFVEGFASGGFCEFDSLYLSHTVISPVCVKSNEASIAALPSEVLRVTYVIDYPGTDIGTEMKDVVLTPDIFASEIAPARTFCTRPEIEKLQKSGLGLGGNANNVLVVGNSGVPFAGYRVERECAAHKIIDILGDIALLGFVPLAHYICICGGHWLHARLVDRMRNGVLLNAGR
ncbi:MAG: UDP-3-O-acyl-N-acetylglucosamine deacetylase [Synergistaceae bacterium]|jgi:UDP-3-O-[3-hydroxymyristoyl] N-acetylglucosamine deacetylase|nr:UDP-3-O-acyl-N-acetylglucosamine deacetylase [Synergistaceae bacterium]